MKNKIALTLFALTLCTAGAFGQAAATAPTPNLDDEITFLRRDIQTERIQIITDNMKFTEAQSTSFWPVYREYAHAQQVAGDQRVAWIKDYAANYDTLTAAQAHSYLLRALKYEDDVSAIRRAYVPKFTKSIGEKATAKFYQVDNQLTLLVNLQLAAELPLAK
jgi:hypothetical protein